MLHNHFTFMPGLPCAKRSIGVAKKRGSQPLPGVGKNVLITGWGEGLQKKREKRHVLVQLNCA